VIVSDCFLCELASSPGEVRAADRIIWLDPRAGLVAPSKGSLDWGSVLVAPLGHYTSLRAAFQDRPQFRTFLSAVMTFLTERLGPITFWEHGSGGVENSPRSACVTHAHLNCIRGEIPLPPPPQAAEFGTLSAALEPAHDPSTGYLLMGHSPGSVVVGEDVGVSQHYRRHWARIVGMPDRWDYMLVDDEDLTRRTVQSLLGGV
jgi:hypothetical protein